MASEYAQYPTYSEIPDGWDPANVIAEYPDGYTKGSKPRYRLIDGAPTDADPQTHHDVAPLIDTATGEEVPRNRPGSPYIEMNIENGEATDVINNYSETLSVRQENDQERARYGAPEIYPFQADIEQYMLNRFIEQGGTLNLWDTNIEVANSNDGKTPFYFLQAAESFITGLELKVKTVGNPAEQKQTSSRRKLLQVAIGASVLGVVGTAFGDDAMRAKNKLELWENGEPISIRYPVTDDDTLGVWGIAAKVYHLDQVQTQEYMSTADIVVLNRQNKEVDDINHIEAGYTVLLPEPKSD